MAMSHRDAGMPNGTLCWTAQPGTFEGHFYECAAGVEKVVGPGGHCALRLSAPSHRRGLRQPATPRTQAGGSREGATVDVKGPGLADGHGSPPVGGEDNRDLAPGRQLLRPAFPALCSAPCSVVQPR